MKIFIKTFVILIILSTFFGCQKDNEETKVAPQKTTLISEEVKDFIQKSLEVDPNSGIIIAIIEGENVDYFSYGKLSQLSDQQIDEHTLFDIGSVTKVFTALLIADLVEKGEMSWDDPIEKYLPKKISVPQKNGQKITLKHLLTHTSRLPAMPTNWEPKNVYDPYIGYRENELYTFLSEYELPEGIGESYEYSNLGYGLLSHILELHYKKSFEEILKEKIFQPLQMKSSMITIPEKLNDRYAKGYAGNMEVPPWTGSYIGGAYAIRSSAHDMVRFLKINMDIVPSDLSSTLKDMQKIYAPATPPSESIAIGWHVHSGTDKTIIWHNGGTGGQRSFIGFDPESKRGAVILTNHAFDLGFTYRLGLPLIDPDLPLPELLGFIEVNENILRGYAGKYEISEKDMETFLLSKNPVLEVGVVEGNISVQMEGEPLFIFYPLTEDVFYYEPFSYVVQFEKNEAGELVGLNFIWGQEETKAKKIINKS